MSEKKMKKGDTCYFAEVPHRGMWQWARFPNRVSLLEFLNEGRKPTSEIVEVKVLSTWATDNTVLLVPKMEDESENFPKKAYQIKPDDLPCEDKHCPVGRAHTVRQCHKIPRCHNPKCKGEQGTHWTEDCGKFTIPPSVCVNPKCGMPEGERLERCMRPKPFTVCQNYKLGI